MINDWTVTFQVYRKKGQGPAHFDTFKLDVNPDEYVLDAVERIWSFHDRSLAFAHACHHSTCGACGMRVNGVEKLTCITPIRSVTANGGTVKIEPMRNFPVISDLVVDTGVMYRRMEAVGHHPVLPLAQEPAPTPANPPQPEDLDTIRLADCIECGLCISACPVALTTPAYLGPAVLAGAQQHGLNGNRSLLELVDSQDGVWRCHSAFECSAVCPSNVDPARKIMDLRKQVIRTRIMHFFRRD